MQENATNTHHQKIAYSVKELSELVGICERKIYYEIEEGKLKTSRIGRRVLILAVEADKWLQQSEAS